MPGVLGCGALDAAGGELPLVIPLASGLPLARITLRSVALHAAPAADALDAGTLCGVITASEIVDVLYPAVVDGVNLLIAAEAIEPATSCTADAACGALEADAICTASNGVDTGYCIHGASAGSSFVENDAFDVDGDGVLTLEELLPILGLILSPDLDLDTSFDTCTGGFCGDGVTPCGGDADCTAACEAEPRPRCEGVRDALSFAVAFTAVGATIDGL
jgi:hypothetical protein